MTNFIKNYFDNKEGDKLKATITPNWDDGTLKGHLSQVGVPKNAYRVYEIGCGIGRLLKEIAKTGKKCYGCDASVSMIKEGRKYSPESSIELCDGTGTIEQPEGDFDFVFSIITFQHIPDTKTVKKYISEAYRILCSGGKFKFQILSEDYKKGFLWSFHPPKELIIHMGIEGFKNIDKQINNRWTIITGEK